jgi:hypothetical protein
MRPLPGGHRPAAGLPGRLVPGPRTGPGPAAVASTVIVASGQAAGKDAGTVTLDTIGADRIVVHLSSYTVAGLPKVNDSLGNIYTALTPAMLPPTASLLYDCARPIVSAAHEIRFSGVGSYALLTVLAVGGTAAVPPDGPAQATTTGTSLRVGEVTPIRAGGLLVTGLSLGGGSGIGITAGFNSLILPYSSGHNMGGGLGYRIPAGPVVVTPTWTWTGPTAAAATLAVFP